MGGGGEVIVVREGRTSRLAPSATVVQSSSLVSRRARGGGMGSYHEAHYETIRHGKGKGRGEYLQRAGLSLLLLLQTSKEI